jgi:hypothetical protein
MDTFFFKANIRWAGDYAVLSLEMKSRIREKRTYIPYAPLKLTMGLEAEGTLKDYEI